MSRCDILDKNGNITGKTADIRDIHDKNYYHRSIQVWIYNDGKLLLQKRSPYMRCYPNCYEASSSGHLDVGETSIEAAVRETKEELGIELQENDFQFLFSSFANEVNNQEFRDVYLVTKQVELNPSLYINKEVRDIKWITLSELEEIVKDNYKKDIHKEYVHHPEEHNKILIQKLKELLK